VLRENADIVQRARTQAGNLAHAVHTPLAILGNAAQADSSALSGSGAWLIRPKTAAALTAPIPGTSSRSRRHDASSLGLATTRRYASTSLTCACSKNRIPLRIA